MSKISAIVLAKNEENMIADCLDSLSFCDEILLVDNGSEDRTAEIASKMGANVLEFKSDDFSFLRNHGLKHANGEWILYVDSDERVTSELARNIKYSCEAGRSDSDESSDSLRSRSAGQISAYKIKRKNFYFGKNEWPKIELPKRLFKKNDFIKWEGKLHETPLFKGNVGELDGYLLHYTHRDLTSMLNKTIEWSKLEAQLRFDANHPKMTWWRFPRVMWTAFFDSYFLQGGWKVGTIGILESLFQSFSIFITYARLWELQQRRK